MHVTVEDGRAVKVAGDPDHPITVGFLCGKVSNYLDRVYSDERDPAPAACARAASCGGPPGTRRSTAWPTGLTRARDEFGGESILPYSYMGTQGLIQGDVMSARVMNALGATALERTICATAGYTGTAMTHGLSPEVDPEEWPNARYVVVWGWNPLSTAPAPVAQAARRPRSRRAHRRGGPVPQPHRARGRRAPEPAARHRRRAGDRDDARDRRRRAAGRGLVPRARRGLRRAAGGARRPHGGGLLAGLRRARPRTSSASGASSRPRGPRCCASAWAHSATWARRPRTPRSPRCRR